MALLPNRNILDGTKVPATTTSDMKTALGSLRDYLAGCLGTDSASPTIPTISGLTSINGGPLGGTRNRLINGDMLINQEFGSAGVTPTSSTYFTDQWYLSTNVGSKLTFQQVVDAPAGYKYSTKVTVASQYAPAAGDTFVVIQPVEGANLVDLNFGTTAPKSITVSLLVKGSVAGTYSCSLRNAAGDRAYVGTITVTTSWPTVKQVVTLVADTTGTWDTATARGLSFNIDVGSGSNLNTVAGAWAAGNFTRTAGSVTFVNQVVGSTLNITGVRLEEGSVATPDEFVPYADKLRWCQRYWEKVHGTVSNNLSVWNPHYPYAVPKRSAASVTLLSISSGTGFAAVPSSYDPTAGALQSAVNSAIASVVLVANARL